MNYGEAKKILSSRRPELDGDETNKWYDDESQAQRIVMLSIAENHERIANSLSKISDTLEKIKEY